MTQPVKDEDQHDADFEKVSSEQKSLTFSLSYSLVEKAVKIIIVVAILVCISVYIGKRMNEGEGLFHKSVKIAILNPSALNEQYLKAHN
ncbi:hypothetical protein ACHM6L_005853, partial [Klebsiella pneumoniae]